MIEFVQKHLLTLADWSPAEIHLTLDLADRLKAMRKNRVPHPLLAGKTLAMIFTKSSTRTRVSFEVGIHELGGYGLFLSGSDMQLGRGETIADTARVLSRYVDGIMIRTFRQSDVEALARYGTVPVINGLTDDYHPCQILADLMTIRERKGELAGRRLAFIGDGNNVANSLLLGCAKTGMHIAVASPEGYEPSAQVVSRAIEIARQTGGSVLLTREPREAVRGANAVYTDVWASMGQESQQAERRAALRAYHVDEALMGLAASDALFLHCLPAHRGEEVAPGVIDGPWSAVFDEAENRLHAQKAVMALLMGQPETLCKI
ncbi:MAG: ornithine carbamoyltransferase [Christensenellales bacterium]|jgi:ornithine carbamoyltransferase